MDVAKIQLSEEELALVQNADWVLTKNRIMEKGMQLFGMLALEMETAVSSFHLPQKIQAIRPKISRGENFQGLPYLMLDYPRLFTKDDIFAIRSFFWWGHYFSITLHLKGIYKEKYSLRIGENISLLAEHGFVASASGDEWGHDLNTKDYRSLQGLNADGFNQFCAGKPFLKIAANMGLGHWGKSAAFFRKASRELLQCL